MRVLTNSSTISKELARLFKECTSCQLAVAWASVGFHVFELLVKRKRKITRMVIGTHFYQTHPDFIETFREHPNVRFVLNPDSVFHPKVYLFETLDGKWECLIGSPNFTCGGMAKNDEVAVLIADRDQGGQEALASVRLAIDGYWDTAKPFSQADLEAYRVIWKRKLPILKNLQGKFGNPNAENSDDKGKHPLEPAILRKTWADYFDDVQKEKLSEYGHSMGARLAVMRAVKHLFATHSDFNSIDREGRRNIAGLNGVVKGVDYGFFGSMKGVGKFQAAVNGKNEHLSKALDMIPLAGGISRDVYLQYIEEYRKAFPEGRDGVATASRLLAMKRPDVFVCLDSKNETRLFKAFGVKGKIGYEKYWDSIIARIMEAAWCNSPAPTEEIEHEVWAARAAFLDSLFYDG